MPPIKHGAIPQCSERQHWETTATTQGTRANLARNDVGCQESQGNNTLQRPSRRELGATQGRRAEPSHNGSGGAPNLAQVRLWPLNID